jgi:hypothetical protein
MHEETYGQIQSNEAEIDKIINKKKAGNDTRLESELTESIIFPVPYCELIKRCKKKYGKICAKFN